MQVVFFVWAWCALVAINVVGRNIDSGVVAEPHDVYAIGTQAADNRHPLLGYDVCSRRSNGLGSYVVIIKRNIACVRLAVVIIQPWQSRYLACFIPSLVTLEQHTIAAGSVGPPVERKLCSLQQCSTVICTHFLYFRSMLRCQCYHSLHQAVSSPYTVIKWFQHVRLRHIGHGLEQGSITARISWRLEEFAPPYIRCFVKVVYIGHQVISITFHHPVY